MEITLGESIESIGENAFSFCYNLKYVKNLERVESLGGGAFWRCYDLEEARLDSIEFIGDYAFVDCTSLKTVTIGAGLKKVLNDAFSGCRALKTVNYAGSESDWSNIEIGEDNGYLKNATINYSILN
jgi:hypothetical protein